MHTNTLIEQKRSPVFLILMSASTYPLTTYLLWLIGTILSFHMVSAQNLIPNPDFNEFYQCPPYPGQIHEAKFWDSPNNTTADYFHPCSPIDQGASVPENLFGYQEAYAGEGYAGLRAWIPTGVGDNIYREYLVASLIDTLEAGQRYQLSFQVSVAETSTHYSDRVAAWITETLPEQQRLIEVTPTLKHEGALIRNMDEWTTISGYFIANGGEAYVLIGNFWNDEETMREPIDGKEGESPTVYYFIDHVVLEKDCGNGSLSLPGDTVLCPGALWEVGTDQTTIQLIQENDSDIVVEREIKDSGQYAVQYQEGGCIYVDTVFVKVEEKTEDEEVYRDTMLCMGESILLNGREDAMAYVWEDGHTEKSISIVSPGIYEVESMFQCGSSRDIFEVVEEDCRCEVFIPNVFSPNQDGLHDWFKVSLPTYSDAYSMEIRDRWGKRVFASKDAHEGWDGTLHQQSLAEGIYFYRIQFQCNSPQAESDNMSFTGSLRFVEVKLLPLTSPF